MTCLCLFSPHYIFCPLSTLSPNFSPLSNSFLPFIFPNAISSPLTATFPLSVFSLISPSLISSLFSLSPSFPFPFFFQSSNLPFFSFPFSLSSLLDIFHISRLPPSLSLSRTSKIPIRFLSLVLVPPFLSHPFFLSYSPSVITHFFLSLAYLPIYLPRSLSHTHSIRSLTCAIDT